ncbi:MAG: hypothetical protein V4492_00980, partial [Chlamydiota bacterium]
MAATTTSVTNKTSYGSDAASWAVPVAMASPVFEKAGELISLFESARAQSTQESELPWKLRDRVEDIKKILNHPHAQTILALAINHLIKTNQSQMLQQVRYLFERDLSKTFRTTGWT